MDLSLIAQAAQFLKGKIRKTPIEFSPALSELLQQPVYLKLECLQNTGSFKLRGAYFYLSTLQVKKVAACSAGNHGLGVATAAKELGIECTVFVPKSVDQAKYEKMVKLGAKVIKSDFVGYDDTSDWAVKEAKRLNLQLVPAFDDEKVMAGNGGTLAVEVLDELSEATNFVLPVGGGGLAAGFSCYVKAKKPNARIICCQLAACPSLKLSLEKGKTFTHMPATETLAGGLEGGLGVQCFDLLKTRIDEVSLITEEEMKKAFCWMLENHQYLIEPSAAVTIAACLFKKAHAEGPTVVVLSGRNVGYGSIQKLVQQ